MVNPPKENTYSFSKLSSYDTCPRMWQLTYLEKTPKLENVFSTYGTLTHEILERYEKGEIDLASLPAVFEWEWDAAFAELEWPPNKFVDLEENYKKQGIAFFENFPGFGDEVKILGVEQHFMFPIDDFYLQGFIDLAYQKDDQLVILDWKTAKTYTKKDLVHKQRQPYLYATWVKDQFGRFPDEIRFYHTRENKITVIPFDENDYREAVDWAKRQVKELRSAWTFEPTPSEFFCRYICSVRGSCECGSGSYWKAHRK